MERKGSRLQRGLDTCKGRIGSDLFMKWIQSVIVCRMFGIMID